MNEGGEGEEKGGITVQCEMQGGENGLKEYSQKSMQTKPFV